MLTYALLTRLYGRYERFSTVTEAQPPWEHPAQAKNLPNGSREGVRSSDLLLSLESIVVERTWGK
jgi:hypothetical protein